MMTGLLATLMRHVMALCAPFLILFPLDALLFGQAVGYFSSSGGAFALTITIWYSEHFLSLNLLACYAHLISKNSSFRQPPN
jgi:hypothetical protein